MKKVAIIGAGNVGAHIASAGILKNLPVEFLLVDMNQQFETAQVLDLKDSLLFSPKAKIRGVDFGDKILSDADIFVITAGVAQKTNESRCELLGRNVEILKSIKKSLGKLKRTAIIIMVTNPVDIMTQLACKIFDLPEGHIFGSGTLLDSSRLRWRLAERCKKNITDVSGFVMGEHGDSEFVAWSTVGGANTLLSAEKRQIEQAVMREVYIIIEGKGATYFGIGSAVAEILDTILSDEEKILPLSVSLQGEFGIKGIALGVPVRLGKNGVGKAEALKLPAEELQKLQESAKKLKNLLKEVHC